MAEDAENHINSAVGGGGAVGRGGGGVSLQLILITWPQAVRQMRGVGGRGERRAGVGQITAHGDPCSSFSLSFFPLCVRRGFDKKTLLSAVPYTNVITVTTNRLP